MPMMARRSAPCSTAPMVLWRPSPAMARRIAHVDAPVSLRVVEAQAVDLPGPETAKGSNGRLGIGEQVQLHGRTRAGDDHAAADALIDPAARNAELLGELGHGQPVREMAGVRRRLQN